MKNFKQFINESNLHMEGAKRLLEGSVLLDLDWWDEYWADENFNSDWLDKIASYLECPVQKILSTDQDTWFDRTMGSEFNFKFNFNGEGTSGVRHPHFPKVEADIFAANGTFWYFGTMSVDGVEINCVFEYIGRGWAYLMNYYAVKSMAEGREQRGMSADSKYLRDLGLLNYRGGAEFED
jgi:hypothetical protein